MGGLENDGVSAGVKDERSPSKSLLRLFSKVMGLVGVVCIKAGAPTMRDLSSRARFLCWIRCLPSSSYFSLPALASDLS